MADISLLAAQYFQQVEAPRLSLPDGPALINPTTQTAIYETMFNEETVWPLPPAPYQTRVLKMILSRLEESISNPEEDEILDTLLEKWTTLLSHPKPSAIQQAQQITYIKYTAPSSSSSSSSLPQTVITSESRNLILASGTTGFRTWEAALHLGSFLSTPHGAALVNGKRVLELGAGTGFLALFCAKHLRPTSVLATDRDPALIDQITDCIAQNKLGDAAIQATIWEWGQPLRSPSPRPHEGGQSNTEGFDIAFGADLIYDVDLVPLLVSTIQDLFENYGVMEFIISATLRNENTFRVFLDNCKRASLAVEQLSFESSPEEEQTGFFHSTSIPIRTYRVSRSRSA